MGAFPVNPALRRLGFSATDRVVIFHADDLGMCQATLSAWVELTEFGLVSSGSIMVPCPWFPVMAAWCRSHPEADIGIHLTLTCEYRSYRWMPLSTCDPASGLLDDEGYLPLNPVVLQQQADPDAVAQEIEAQLARAVAAGVQVSHLDTHQLSVWHHRLVRSYVNLALRNHLPFFFLRLEADRWQALGQRLGLPMSDETAAYLEQLGHELEEQGLPLFDHALMLPLDQPADRVAQARQALASLPPGLTHFVLHPATDTPELRAITSDWPSRVADYRAFTSRELRAAVRQAGVQVIGYHDLKTLLS